MQQSEMDLGSFGANCGYQMLEWESGRAVICMPIAKWMFNRSGLVHGGMIAALIDTAAGLSGTFFVPPAPRPLGLTLSLTTAFVGRANGERLVATGVRTGGGRNIFFARAEVADPAGNLVATGEGTYRLRAMVAP